MTSFVDGLHFRLRNDAYLKHDGTALMAIGRKLTEPQRVTTKITMGNDFVLLIMVAQNHQTLSPVLANRVDSIRQSRVVKLFVRG